MKHHRHSIGWKRANHQDHVRLWKEIGSFVVVSTIAISLVIGCMLLIKK